MDVSWFGNLNWLGDLSFWAWAIPLAVTIALGSFQVGVWWSDRDRAKAVAEREDQEYRKRNSATLRIRPQGISDDGHFIIGITNVGDHRAMGVQVRVDCGVFQRSLGDETLTLAPQDGFPAMVFVGLERPVKGGYYTPEDMSHLPADSHLEIVYSDGLGEHRRRWTITIERKGEELHLWEYRAEPLER